MILWWFVFFSKIHEELRKQSMLHALDYSNMDLTQLKAKVKDARRKDKEMSKFVRYEAHTWQANLFGSHVIYKVIVIFFF